jgi:putative radical SAM enzyme (TIGR03279 family)
MNKAVVKLVEKGSVADEIGIEAGDIITRVNGVPVEDELDFRFYTADDYVEITVLKKNGEVYIFELETDETDLGIAFEDALFGGAKSCRNKCIFCFIDQLPKGMRSTLYFKDDDSRLSFLTGNYITATNLTDKDIDKIIKMRLEPINISVHTTNGDLRRRMLNNKRGGEVLDVLNRLRDNKIHMNAQIVLVRNTNDKEELDKTIDDLSKLYPYVTSVSVVPVGITKYREGLYPLTPFTKEESAGVLGQVSGWQKKLLDKIGSRFIYAADEFYIKAGKPFPGNDEYEGYHQIENGVGLIRSLIDEFRDELRANPPKSRCSASIATGVAAYDTINMLAGEAMEKYPDVKIKVFKIKNNFFGENITVAGLLTGRDIIARLKGERIAGNLLLPDVMLKSGTEMFLDDLCIPDVEKELGINIVVTKCSGYELWKNIQKKD